MKSRKTINRLKAVTKGLHWYWYYRWHRSYWDYKALRRRRYWALVEMEYEGKPLHVTAAELKEMIFNFKG